MVAAQFMGRKYVCRCIFISSLPCCDCVAVMRVRNKTSNRLILQSQLKPQPAHSYTSLVSYGSETHTSPRPPDLAIITCVLLGKSRFYYRRVLVSKAAVMAASAVQNSATKPKRKHDNMKTNIELNSHLLQLLLIYRWLNRVLFVMYGLCLYSMIKLDFCSVLCCKIMFFHIYHYVFANKCQQQSLSFRGF